MGSVPQGQAAVAFLSKRNLRVAALLLLGNPVRPCGPRCGHRRPVPEENIYVYNSALAQSG